MWAFFLCFEDRLPRALLCLSSSWGCFSVISSWAAFMSSPPEPFCVVFPTLQGLLVFFLSTSLPKELVFSSPEVFCSCFCSPLHGTFVFFSLPPPFSSLHKPFRGCLSGDGEKGRSGGGQGEEGRERGGRMRRRGEGGKVGFSTET